MAVGGLGAVLGAAAFLALNLGAPTGYLSANFGIPQFLFGSAGHDRWITVAFTIIGALVGAAIGAIASFLIRGRRSGGPTTIIRRSV